MACPGAWSRAPGEPGGSAVRTGGLFRALPGLGRKREGGVALAGVSTFPPPRRKAVGAGQPQSSPSSSTGSSLSGGRLRRRLRITMASGLPLSAFQRFQCFPPQGPAVPAASHPCRDRCRDHCRRADGTEAGASTAEDNDSDNDLDNDGTDHRSPTACARSLTRGVGNGHTGFLHVPADEQRP